MIVSGTSPPISIDWGKDEAGMILQFRNVERDRIVWRDYLVNGEIAKSPFDIDKLPGGRYRLINPAP